MGLLPFELSLTTAPGYLAARGMQFDGIRELGGGVSNAVLLAGDTVIKQSLGKLRVEQDWFADRERIHRECDAIRMLGPLLPPHAVPAIIFEDRENCIFGMTAAPPPTRPWKTALLEDRAADPRTVRQAAELLAQIIEVSRGQAEWRERFRDTAVFDQLRLDAYYRATAARHPDIRSFFDELIAETLQRDYSLVHGDWSPKNLLVSADTVTAIDFEAVHYGDPAFDIAFLLNHLLLKSLHLEQPQLLEAAQDFFSTISGRLREGWLETAVIRHLGALMLARVDGKSPAEYIQGTAQEPRVREIARGLIVNPPRTIAATIKRVE